MSAPLSAGTRQVRWLAFWSRWPARQAPSGAVRVAGDGLGEDRVLDALVVADVVVVDPGLALVLGHGHMRMAVLADPAEITGAVAGERHLRVHQAVEEAHAARLLADRPGE